MEYSIIEAGTSGDLVDHVNRAIGEGWKPTGGVQTFWKNDIHGGSTAAYFQAMVRESSATRAEPTGVNYESVWSNVNVFGDIVESACDKFKSPCGRLFNSACFIHAMRRRVVLPDALQSDALLRLACQSGVVRLKGGHHWYALPKGIERHQD